MKRFLNAVAVVSLVAVLSGVARSDDRTKPDQGNQDARIRQGVVNALQLGVPLYNNGDPVGCYRVYQGALYGLLPFLADRPELKSAIESGMGIAQAQPTAAQQATVARQLLDQIHDAAKPGRPLWDRLGG